MLAALSSASAACLPACLPASNTVATCLTLQAPVGFEYVNLHYAAADGSARKLRASPNHAIIIPSTAIPQSSPQATLGPGTFKRMELVQVSSGMSQVRM